MNSRVSSNFKQWMKWNVSALFLLQVVTGTGIGMFHTFGLENTYLYDEKSIYNGGNYLFVVLYPGENKALTSAFIQTEYEKRKLITDYDVCNGRVVLVYEIDAKWNEDLEKFKLGEYSKLSDEFKSMHDQKISTGGYISSYKEEKSFQFMVFTKDEIFKKELEEYFDVKMSNSQELWEKPLKEKETINHEKFHC